VLLSALGPVMLRIAGELANGTITVWATPATIADHIRPTPARRDDRVSVHRECRR
jgi:alkanesulfonate monooxygenase SsuD/methylene tetrahydromethanopterin reductase-like flavin-dependent oxidoreductase (luciferase family)